MVEPMRVLYLALLAFVCTGALAEQNGSPRLIRLGCNFDGGLAWLALGKASAGPRVIPSALKFQMWIWSGSYQVDGAILQNPCMGPVGVKKKLAMH